MRMPGYVHTMQSAAAAIGGGSPMPTDDFATVGMQVTGTFVATITFQGTVDLSNWVTIEVTSVTDGSKVQTATATGVWTVPTNGLRAVRAYISSWTSGTVTVSGYGTSSVSSGTGQVGGSGIAPSDSFTRPANTTAYTANDAMGILLTVTGATNATPIVITTATHGLSTGDRVTVASVGGTTGANGDWAITVVSTTTFSLDTSVGNAAYTSGGTVAKCLQFKNVARSNGGGGLIVGALLIDSGYATTKLQARLMLFHTQPTVQGDNVASAITDAHMLNGVGFVDFTTTPAPGDATADTGNCITQVPGSGLWVQCAAADVNLYGQLIALNAYTPYSLESISVKIKLGART